jgi:glycosyltransferase involved in cell wall biosynthesis
MSVKLPLVSVLVCNYNYASYVEETLRSILNQDYENIEVVIVDDGSSDNSKEIIERFERDNQDVKLVSKYKKKNQGLCFARNDAIELSSGDFFMFLDSDDTIPFDYVSKMYKKAVTDKADVVYGDVKKFGDETGSTDYPSYDPKLLLITNFINISSLVKKTKIAEHRFDENLNHKTLEDYDFWLGLSLMGLRFVKANDVYLNYRVQNKSRNENSSSVSDRILSFVDIWQYSISKYRKKYPHLIKEDIVYEELRYRIEEIGTELNMLNLAVQNELVPELQKRSDHIEHQGLNIQALESANQLLNESLTRLRDTKWHRAGQLIAKIPQKIKNRVK